MKPKIDYFELMTALYSHYRVSPLYGWPPMFNLYAEQDEDEENPIASVESREGAFKIWVSKIVVDTKEVDEFFQRLLGLDYYKVRIDQIQESENRSKHRDEEEYGDTDDYEDLDEEEYEDIDDDSFLDDNDEVKE